MNIFLFLLAATLVLISYHPQKGWIFPPSAIVVAYVYAASAVLFVLVIFSILLKKSPKLEKILRSLILGVVVTSLAWIQIDYFLNSATQFSSLQWNEKTLGYHLIQGVILLAISLMALIFFRTKARLSLPVVFGHLLTFSIVFSVLLIENRFAQPMPSPIRSSMADLPNIYLITVDSLEKAQLENASYFPRLSQHLGEFQQAAYHYTNACCTHPSVSVLYTGQTVDRTKVSYLPAYLKGKWRSHNLPNILKELGYETHAYISSDHGNARKIGIDGGFDFIEGFPVPLFETHDYIGYFQNQTHVIMVLRKLAGDVFLRFNKFFVDPRTINPFDEVTSPEIKTAQDKTKTAYLLKLAEKEEKVFVHAHFLKLHQTKRENEKKIFHSLTTIDRQLADLIASLKKNNKWNDMLFILSSDHGMWWTTEYNLPLFLKLPAASQNRNIGLEYTQTADIMPTILDLLGVEIDWELSGISLFHENPIARNFIVLKHFNNGASWVPPYYKIVELVIRNREKTTSIPAENIVWDDQGNLALEESL